MKNWLLLLILLTLSIPAHAQVSRLEDIAAKVYQDLETGQYKAVEERLNGYREQDVKTRHGTDLFLDVINNLIEIIDAEGSHEKWDRIDSQWNAQPDTNYARAFFSERFKHAQALYLTQDVRSSELMQSQVRRYKEVMGNSYNRYLKIINDYPDEWRTHAYLSHNYKRYKLNAVELNKHFLKTQSMKKGEVSSMEGYISALSPYEMGRDDKIIKKGIEAILRKYPDRNLSKPEFIDETTKQEIEDTIFELSIGRMLLTAREYREKADKNSYAPILIPMVYSIIDEDLHKHYKDRKDKIEQHPLSLKRDAVWNEIESNFAILLKRFPSSGKYLSEYLKLSMQSNNSDKVKMIFDLIEEKDPNYEPSKLAPIQCDYFSSLEDLGTNEATLNKMYASCKKTTQYNDNEIYLYRAGWAAREMKNYIESNKFLEQAVKKAPDNPTYLTDMCWNYKDLKDFNKALDYCDKAISADRKFARAWLGRAHINYYGFKNKGQGQKDAQMYKHLTEEQK